MKNINVAWLSISGFKMKASLSQSWNKLIYMFCFKKKNYEKLFLKFQSSGIL